MSALQTLIAAADGTTDEAAHVFVPVSVIRELQAWMPGERERLTANGVKAWAGVDPQSLRDEPEHVQRAAMDELEREFAMAGVMSDLSNYGRQALAHGLVLWAAASHCEVPFQRCCDYLRYRGLLVEHGDGVVSIRERSNG